MKSYKEIINESIIREDLSSEHQEIKMYEEKNKALIDQVKNILKKNKIRLSKPQPVKIMNNTNIFYTIETAIIKKGMSYKTIAKSIAADTKGKILPGGYSDSITVECDNIFLEISKNRSKKIEINFKIGTSFSWIK